MAQSTGFLIKRINITADRDITLIGKRLMCGSSAEPYDSIRSAESAIKRQEKQDLEYCLECCIVYEIIPAS